MYVLTVMQDTYGMSLCSGKELVKRALLDDRKGTLAVLVNVVKLVQ